MVIQSNVAISYSLLYSKYYTLYFNDVEVRIINILYNFDEKYFFMHA